MVIILVVVLVVVLVLEAQYTFVIRGPCATRGRGRGVLVMINGHRAGPGGAIMAMIVAHGHYRGRGRRVPVMFDGHVPCRVPAVWRRSHVLNQWPSSWSCSWTGRPGHDQSSWSWSVVLVLEAG